MKPSFWTQLDADSAAMGIWTRRFGVFRLMSVSMVDANLKSNPTCMEKKAKSLARLNQPEQTTLESFDEDRQTDHFSRGSIVDQRIDVSSTG